MLKAYKYRLYPNKAQEEFFMKCFGAVRFIYNHMLSEKIKCYQKTKKKLNNTPAQYKDKFPWLKEVDSHALCYAQMNLQSAYNMFFKRPEFGFPKFKSKKTTKLSYSTSNTNNYTSIKFSDSNKYIKLPKIGLIRVKRHRSFDGIIKSATISKTSSGKYYISLLVECEDPKKLQYSDNKVGIDLGLKEFAITSDGEMIENPRYFRKSEKRLRKLQKDLSRCKKGGQNREKCRIKLAKQHEKVANQRKDFLHKTSKRIINENQVICLEDLKAKEVLMNHKIAKSVCDASWYEFFRQLNYKSKWYGREVIKIDKWYPSSQICSNCGHRDGKKNLSIREWTCPVCGAHHDRDVNAAINILNEGLRIRTVGDTGIV